MMSQSVADYPLWGTLDIMHTLFTAGGPDQQVAPTDWPREPGDGAQRCAFVLYSLTQH